MPDNQTSEWSCTDRLDDEGDGFVDCEDTECQLRCGQELLCDDGRDNDSSFCADVMFGHAGTAIDYYYDYFDLDLNLGMCIVECDPSAPDCRDDVIDFYDDEGTLDQTIAYDCINPYHTRGFGCYPNHWAWEWDCGDGLDNDRNGSVDCDDERCALDPVCLCAGGATFDEAAFTVFGSNAGQGDDFTGYCWAISTAGAEDSEYCWQVPSTGRYRIALDTIVDYWASVYVLESREGVTACTDMALDAVTTLEVDLDAGQTVVLVIDDDPRRSAAWQLDVEPVLPESDCSNFWTDDFDPYIDCEDRDCGESASCAGGSGAVGAPCSTHNDCSGVGAIEPFCLAEDFSFDLYPGGYCAPVCDLFAANSCPEGSACVDGGLGASHCLSTCDPTEPVPCREDTLRDWRDHPVEYLCGYPPRYRGADAVCYPNWYDEELYEY